METPHSPNASSPEEPQHNNNHSSPLSLPTSGFNSLSLEDLPTSDHVEKNTHMKFLVSNAEAGTIIGKGGATISDFQSQSGARIQLSRNFEYFPGTNDRIVMVSGTVDDILKVVDLILAKLLNEFYAGDDTDVDHRSKVRLIVPNSSCGRIIGKGGAAIKSLIEESQADIKISPQDNNYLGLNDRLVTLTGNLDEQMRAIELILLKLEEDPYYTRFANALFPYVATYNALNYGANRAEGKFQNSRFQNKQDDMSNSVTIGVADEHIGIIVGRGGRNISEISQRSGARIKISDRGDFMSGTNDRKVTITGSQRAIQIAENLISSKVASVSEVMN